MKRTTIVIGALVVGACTAAGGDEMSELLKDGGEWMGDAGGP